MRLNEYELDALAEVINIGSGLAANSLSEITGSRIVLAVPQVYVCDSSEISKMAKNLDWNFGTTIRQDFEGRVSGRALLAFSEDNAFELARAIGDIPTSDAEMDDELCGILEELGNIVLNSLLGAIANITHCSLAYTLPQLCTKNTYTKIIRRFTDASQSSESIVLVADTSITVASRDISGSLLLLFETGDVEVLISSLNFGVPSYKS